MNLEATADHAVPGVGCTGRMRCVLAGVAVVALAAVPARALNTALEFNGSTQYVNLGNDGNSAALNYLTNFGTSSFTVEGWFYVDAANSSGDNISLFRQGSKGSYPQVAVQIPNGTAALGASVETSTTSTQVDTATPGTFTLQQWHHFALVVVRDLETVANQRMNLYLDGALVESTVAASWSTHPIDDSLVGETRDAALLGVARTAPGANYNYYFDGRLDEVRIWDHARTQQQIQDNMNAPLTAAAGLVHRWGMNEGTGTTAADSVGTAHGALVGATWVAGAPLSCSAPEDCDDLDPCTLDTCDAGTCAHTAVACPTGQTCNPVSGQCETVAPLPIYLGAEWKYRKGTSAPPADWNTVLFDDSGSDWLSGPSGFGYGASGSDCEPQRVTNLPDMTTVPYVSLYLRKLFFVADPAAIYGLNLTMYYDDAFVVYLNGQEVARSITASNINITGSPPAYGATASPDHECSGAETFVLDPTKLVTGLNVIAIQAHNSAQTSSDFVVAPQLEAVAPPNPAPDMPTNPSPASEATAVTPSPELCADVSDTNGDTLTVTFYGREAGGAAGEPFTIVVLPDPQNYAAGYPTIYNAQTQWCVDNRTVRNIVFVTALGDMTNDNSETQWGVADTAMSILDTAGLPYGIALGNHDGSPSDTALYNQHFGVSRFTGRAYYGGHYGVNNDNHYELFTAGGMDFIIFHLECEMGSGYEGICSAECQDVLLWVHGLLTGAHANRRAIIVSHALMQPSGTFMAHGQAVYTALRDCPNFFMTVCGHLDQANHRVDLGTDGHPIYSLIQDYQMRSNGGNGWLRIMTFDPQADTIHVETYSPTVEGGRFINKPTAHADNQPNETGGNELLLTYDMDAGAPFVQLGQLTGVTSGSRACLAWPGRTLGKTYEWYVTVSDGTTVTTGSRWQFTVATTCATDAECEDGNPCTDNVCNPETLLCESANNTAPCSDDANPCTTDVCGDGACTHVPNDSGTCSDGNACTTDACLGGSCVSTYTPTDGCCATQADCNDGNPATDDVCTDGDCTNPPVQSCTTDEQCNDDNVCTSDHCNLANAAALKFDGTNDYVTMGAAAGEAALGARAFTLEAWVKRDGTTWGVTTSTGTGGITAVPLVTKGRGESDTGNLNCNYFLGLIPDSVTPTTVRVTADFEQIGAAGGWADGQNHPACGTGLITDQNWHHVAATYSVADGWRIYVDGIEGTTADGTSCTSCSPAGSCPRSPGVEPEYDSIQYFGLGTALTSTGAAAGFFAGVMDEARVWNRVLSPAEIQANMNSQVTSAVGLIGRWGLNEGSGTQAGDATTPAENGTLTGGPVWVTSELPNLGSGTCQHTAISGCCNTAAECDDASACTVDTCVSHACVHEPVGECCVDADCNDQNACTDDTCVDYQCVYTANDTNTCDDGNACTTDDHCASAVCTGTHIPECCATDLDCKDLNPCTVDTCPSSNVAALSLDGINDYVDFGAASTHTELGLSRFTIECWFKKTGAGVATAFMASAPNNAVPLVTKGRGVGDGGTLDLNYFLGIVNATEASTLVFSFEQIEEAVGADNVVQGTVNIDDSAWHHAAVTYDGAMLRLYTDGVPDGTPLATTKTPRWDSMHRFALGTGYSDYTGGGPSGYFAGYLDEVRVWDHARTQAEIQTTMNQQVLAGTGLVGRWGMNEGAGTALSDATLPASNGTLNGANWISTGLVDFGTGGWCVHTPVSAGTSCSDGVFCNGAETCQDGVCTGGTPPCDGAHCHEEIPACWACNNDTECADGNPCTTDVCNSSSHECEHTPIAGCCQTAAECDDSDHCTTDACIDNLCENVPIPQCCTSDNDCSDGDVCTLDFCPGSGNAAALNFDGTDDYVTMGAAAGETALGARAFTLEAWVKRDGTTWGVTTSTGTGGITAVPLVTKGRGESDTGNLNCNYFLGLIPDSVTPTTVRVTADFEQIGAAGGWADGQNHPACGTGLITDQNWHHVAATYSVADGWRIYVDGIEGTTADGTSCTSCSPAGSCPRSPGVEPEYDSIQHFGLGTALTSTGVAAGFLAGVMDEARVWNYARSQAEIQANMYREITTAAGLIGHWALDENTGTTAGDSTTPAENGTLKNGPAWVNDDLVDFGTPEVCEHLPIAGCCHTAADCGDGLLCTADACVGNACEHAAIPGCCTSAVDCNDGNSCTIDTCLNNVCVNELIPECCLGDAACYDGAECTADACNTANVAALELSGTSQYVNLGNDGNSAALNYLTNFGTSSFTIEGWFWADAAADNISLFRQGSQNSYPQVVVQLKSGAKLAASVETSTSPSQIDTGTPPTFSLGAWHHFAMVVVRDLVTPANQRLNLYLDGVLKESTVAAAWAAYPINDTISGSTRDPVWLGAVRGAPGGSPTAYFDGRLDEIRIWDHARTAQQIADNMNKQVLTAPGLQHRWAANEGSGTTTADTGLTPTTAAQLAGSPTWRTLAVDIPVFGNDRCVHTLSTGVCLIDLACHADGTVNPANACQICDADGNPTDWTDRDNGTVCDDGQWCTENDHCTDGACAGTARDCDDHLGCTTDSCNEAQQRCDNVVQSGFCRIGDACQANGALNPANECEYCDAVANPTGWTPRGSDASCGGVLSGPCDAQDMCDGAGACVANYQPAGTPCRAASGDCDVAESCTGTSTECPADAVQPSEHECRAAAGACDVAEKCDGIAKDCPANAFQPNGTPCDDQNACTDGDTCDGQGACSAGAAVTCNDNDPCTVDTCEADRGCVFTPTQEKSIYATIQVQGLGAAVTRPVTLVVTDCHTPPTGYSAVDTRVVPVSFSAGGIGVVSLPNVNPHAEWIQITEGHTLSRRLALQFVGCLATVTCTDANMLLSGDFSNPPWVPQSNHVDIQDFAILAIYWNTPVNANLGSLADATGDGLQGVGDFGAIQANFARQGDGSADCPLTVSSVPGLQVGPGAAGAGLGEYGEESLPDSTGRPGPPSVQLSVAVAVLGIPNAERADRNGDGVIDLRDIRLFAAEHRLQLTPAFRVQLERLERLYLGPTQYAPPDVLPN